MRRAFYGQRDVIVRKLGDYRVDFPTQEAIGIGAWERLLAMALYESSDLFLEPLKAHIQEALVVGQIAAMGDLPIGISVRLDNPRAVFYARSHAAEMVTRINGTTREALNRIIVQATEEGWSYSQTARAIDLQFRHWAVVPRGEARAKLIAITETGNAYSEANLIVGQTLRDEGLLIEKLWSTRQDERVSDGCARNQAEGWIPVEQPFPSGHMRPLRFPGCRCDLMQRLRREGREPPTEFPILRR